MWLVCMTVPIGKRLNRRESCIHGHHIYKYITNPFIKPQCACAAKAYSSLLVGGQCSATGRTDTIKKGVAVDHWTFTPKTVLALLTEGGTIDCMVTGARRHSTKVAWKFLFLLCAALVSL